MSELMSMGLAILLLCGIPVLVVLVYVIARVATLGVMRSIKACKTIPREENTRGI